LDRIVPGVDLDISKALARAFEKQGMTVRTGVEVQGHTPRGDGSGTTVNVGNGEAVDVDVVVMSIGRRPFADHLGLDALGVETDERGFVKVDEYCRTNVDGVYALGDLVATPALAHVGFAEAIMVVQDVLGEAPVPIDYDRVPWAIYCHPEVAFAGLTEEQARDAGYEVVVSKHRYVGNSRAVIIGDTEGMVKIVAERQPDGRAGRLLGVHMMGPWATEQLGQGYLAVNWEANVDEVAAFIQPHPTLSELFGESVLALTGRSLHA
jgi:dihydrolipoamide dehydrogenase